MLIGNVITVFPVNGFGNTLILLSVIVWTEGLFLRQHYLQLSEEQSEEEKTDEWEQDDEDEDEDEDD